MVIYDQNLTNSGQNKRKARPTDMESDDATNDQEMLLVNDIQTAKPLILIDVAELKNDQKKLKTLTESWFKDADISSMKFTQNDNLIIFPKSNSDYEILIAKNLDYNNKKFEELTPRGFPIVLFMSYEEAISFESDITLEGIIDIKEMKSAKNPSLKLRKCKILCNNLETQNQLLKDGLKLNYQKFRCEPFKTIAKITQCFKCQQLGHIAKKCRSGTSVCAKCGKSGHDIDESGKLICKEDKKSCVLCSQEHSAAYANCPVKIDKLKEIKNKINKNSYANKLINNNNNQNNNNNDNFNNNCNNNNNELLKEFQRLNENLKEQLTKTESILNRLNLIDEQFLVINDKIETIQKTSDDKISKLSYDIDQVKNNYSKLMGGFLDFYYICNTKKPHDATSIENLRLFLNKFGHKKSTIEINDRFTNLTKTPAPASTNLPRKSIQ